MEGSELESDVKQEQTEVSVSIGNLRTAITVAQETLNQLIAATNEARSAKANLPQIHIRMKTLPHCYAPPQYAELHDAGADIYSANHDPVIIKAKGSGIIPTGIALEIPPGYEGQVRGRSGLAFKHQISITQGLGTIDSGYRGEIMVLLTNHGDMDFEVRRGVRIAQIVFNQIHRAVFSDSTNLSNTSRGEGGFGSTGMV